MTNNKLAEILEWEIARLHARSAENPLDIADLVRLEKLIASCAKFKPLSADDSGALDKLTTEELLSGLKKTDDKRTDEGAGS